jgi:putative transposase
VPIIQHAAWLYLRFILSYRDVENLLAERGLDLSHETVERWVLKFGPVLARQARQPRQGRQYPRDQWHLDEMVVHIAGKQSTYGAPSTTRARSSRCWFSAGATSAPRWGSYASCSGRRVSRQGRWSPTNCVPAVQRSASELPARAGLRLTNRAENSRQTVRRQERKMQRFKSAQRDRSL